MNSALFFEELMKQMDIDEPQNDDKRCLISHEPLDDNAVTLTCNHSFNYPEILSEVIRQKKVFNSKETQRLKCKEIKCPYCRKVTDGLLPPREGFDNIKGVNFPYIQCFTYNTCKRIFKSGKRKGQLCGVPCKGDFCSRHIPKINLPENVGENVVIESLRCKAILTSGKNKGQQCSRKKKNGEYCGIHIKKYNENN